MSAILWATPWNLPIGWPNRVRVRAYPTDVSSRRSIVPTWLAKRQTRSQSMVSVKTAAPPPTPHWTAACNRIHDLLLAHQWVHYLYPTEIRACLESRGLECLEEAVIKRLFCSLRY